MAKYYQQIAPEQQPACRVAALATLKGSDA
jgi:hypothetical protein